MRNYARKVASYRLAIGLGLMLSLATTAAYAQTGPYQFYSLTPCRVVDTRNAPGTNGGPNLGTTRRDFVIKGNCGVPTTAKAVSINLAVTGASTTSWLTIWPAGQAIPNTAAINFSQNDWALSNGAIVGLAAGSPDLSIQNANGTVAVIVDVTGYFQ
jgi:serine protease